MGATTKELDELRARIAATPRNRQGDRKYDDALKQDVRQYAQRRIRAGVAHTALAAELDISPDTLWGWLHKVKPGEARRRENSLPKGAKEFRAALAALGPRAPTTTYAPELRVLGVAYHQERRAEGATLREIASELGVGTETVRNWIQGRPPRKPRAVRQVTIAPRRTPTTSMVIHGPAGVRIEGVDVATVAALLKELS
jgi:transposase